MLYREGLRDVVQVMHKDEDARYMWIRLHTGRPRDLYVAICYFPPSNSGYASRDGGPFDMLYEDIMKYASIGEILLMGDFNARTGNRQSVFYMHDDAMFREIDHDEVGLCRAAQDKEMNAYGTHLFTLGNVHELAIFNGLSRWLRSDA